MNPCGFPLLPAFLSFYVGAEDGGRRTRVSDGVVVGMLVSAGFLGAFAVLGLPIAYGVTLVTDALPWAGIAIGAALALVGVASLLGRGLPLPGIAVPRAERHRRSRSILLFGAGYGIASLGCTLPLFLALVGASSTAGGRLSTLGVFGAYAVGTGVVLTALSLGAALLKEGLARSLRRVLPHMHRIGGALLVVSGLYVVYYWWRVHYGPKATLADDPVVGVVTRFTARVQTLADDAGLAFVVGALALAAALGFALWLLSRARSSGHTVID